MTEVVSPRRRRRLVFPLVVLALMAALVGWIWLRPEGVRQARVMASIPVAVIGTLLLVVWATFFSRWSRKTRWAIGMTILAVGAASAASLRINGVTGDLVPIVQWRWQSDALAALPGEQPEAASAAGAATSGVSGEPATGEGRAASDAPAPATPEAPPTRAARPDASTPATTTAGPAPAPPSPWEALSFPQFLGPTRDGVLPGPALARDWTARPPREIWRIRVGAGWSGFAVGRGLAITQEQRGDQETVVAYDLATGRPRWSHGDRDRYATVIAGEGPRATPAIAQGRVVTLGSNGLLNAVDIRTGRRLWQRRVNTENDAPDPQWGRSGSPLVLDGTVIVSAGGSAGRSLVAYSLADGAPTWHGGDDGAGYSSPTVMTLAGRPQIVILNQRSLAGHDPETGALLWSLPWPHEQPNVAQPIPLGPDLVLASSGYGVGAKLVRIRPEPDGRLTPALVWESPRLKSKFANLILHRGFVYGLDDGVMVCLDPATGERKWKAGRYGHGQLLLVGSLLLVHTEEGELLAIDPSPDGLKELARMQTFSGKTWNPPTLVGPYLLLRTDREAALFELPVE